MPLTQDRDTKRIAGHYRVLEVAASVKIFTGALVARDANGRATPGAASTTIRGVGRAVALADNSAGAAGAISVEVETGTFYYKNSTAGDAITNADIGSDCYIVDDETVAKTNGTNTRSVAGKVYAVDPVLGVAVTFA